MNLLSILVPTRDRPEMLRMALNSLSRNKRINEVEVIVQDNSTTNTNFKKNYDICKEFDWTDHYKASDDLSMTDNWSEGLNKCNGNFFLRLDDDNFLLKGSVDYFLDILSKNVKSYAIQFNSLYLDHNEDAKVCFFLNGSSIIEDKNLEVFEVCDHYDNYLKAEFNCILDSNYLLINKKNLFNLLDNPYQTPLPDRYLAFNLLQQNLGKRYYVSNTIVGCSRFDYRSRQNDIDVSIREYFHGLSNNLHDQKLLKNFGYARALTLKICNFENLGTKLISDLDFNDFLLIALEGHLSELKNSNFFSRLKIEFIYFPYMIFISAKLFIKKFKGIYLSKIFIFLFLLISFPIRYFRKSNFNSERVDASYGDNFAKNASLTKKNLINSKYLYNFD